MARGRNNNGGKKEKKVTRYTYEHIKEPRTPETGHTALLPADEQVVTLPMDSGWSKALRVGQLSDSDATPVVVDVDPAADPTLFWAGKRNKRLVPVLPLQRNEIVSESRIAQIIDRALENYIDVICRLYRKNAAVQGASGLVHAIAESGKERVAISVGPLSGRVTAKQINDAVQDALSSGIFEVHVLGWAFEANVGEVKSQLESRGKVKVELIMIRPDTLAEGLKATQSEMLFSPLALPDIDVKVKKGKNGGEAVVKLKGVALFDRRTRTTTYKHADSGYVSAWYLDEDYDGDCFVDCQMFFDFKKAPNLKATLRTEVDPDEYKLQLESRPFCVRGYRRVAVKVVDVYGNESTVVRALA